MDDIQQVLIKMGRKDLAQQYYSTLKNAYALKLKKEAVSREDQILKDFIAQTIKSNPETVTYKQFVDNILKLPKNIPATYSQLLPGVDPIKGSDLAFPLREVEVNFTKFRSEIKRVMGEFSFYMLSENIFNRLPKNEFGNTSNVTMNLFLKGSAGDIQNIKSEYHNQEQRNYIKLKHTRLTSSRQSNPQDYFLLKANVGDGQE